MRYAFTLIELIVVVLLISIVYGIYFFVAPSHKDVKVFSLDTMKEYLQEKQTIVCNEDKELCYILDANYNVVDKVEFKNKIKVYFLTPDERLELFRYTDIEIDKDYFTPSLIFKKLTDDLTQNLIYFDNVKNKWVYISPYIGNMQEFDNKEEIISFIKKRSYLPMESGLAE